MNLTAFALVATGGALGAIARYALTLALPRELGELPLATLLSNLIGCLVIGAALQWLAESDWLSGTRVINEHYRLLIAIGFCGSFTTLSSMVFEMGAMMERSLILNAFSYLAVTLVGGFVCFYAGAALVRTLSGLTLR
jgi:fluoride exporter